MNPGISISPVTSATLEWKNIHYSIPTPERKGKTFRKLINGVSGQINPGEVKLVLVAHRFLYVVLGGRHSRAFWSWKDYAS